MKEIEIKVLDIDRSAIEERLKVLCAKKIFDDKIHALYYDSSDNAVRRRGCVLRLRKEGGRSILTLKKDIDSAEAKIREEHEIEVSDFNGTRYLLEALGLDVWLELKKRRTSYVLEGVHFEIDSYYDAFAYIPQFMEIEGPDIETIYAYAGLLGFTKKDCKPWDIMQVAEYYSGQRQGK